MLHHLNISLILHHYKVSHKFETLKIVTLHHRCSKITAFIGRIYTVPSVSMTRNAKSFHKMHIFAATVMSSFRKLTVNGRMDTICNG